MAHIVQNILDSKIPIKFMLSPGHLYSPISPQPLASYVLNLLEQDVPIQGPIEILGDTPYSLWQLCDTFAKRQEKKLFPLSTTIVEKLPTLLKDKILKHERLQQMVSVDRRGFGDCSQGVQRVILPFQAKKNHDN